MIEPKATFTCMHPLLSIILLLLKFIHPDSILIRPTRIDENKKSLPLKIDSVPCKRVMRIELTTSAWKAE
ncbi:MAG: hypothetical protein ACI4XS_04535, partial [Bacillus sp. (in: firmicutes)]